MESLANGVDFKDTEDFAEKISEIKEAYFPTEGDNIAEEFQQIVNEYVNKNYKN